MGGADVFFYDLLPAPSAKRNHNDHYHLHHHHHHHHKIMVIKIDWAESVNLKLPPCLLSQSQSQWVDDDDFAQQRRWWWLWFQPHNHKKCLFSKKHSQPRSSQHEIWRDVSCNLDEMLRKKFTNLEMPHKWHSVGEFSWKMKINCNSRNRKAMHMCTVTIFLERRAWWW